MSGRLPMMQAQWAHASSAPMDAREAMRRDESQGRVAHFTQTTGEGLFPLDETRRSQSRRGRCGVVRLAEEFAVFPKDEACSQLHGIARQGGDIVTSMSLMEGRGWARRLRGVQKTPRQGMCFLGRPCSTSGGRGGGETQTWRQQGGFREWALQG